MHRIIRIAGNCCSFLDNETNVVPNRVVNWGFRLIIAILVLTPPVGEAAKYAGEFQELGVGGRACAMGGVGVAQFADPSVIYFNPAGSFFVPRSVLLMHAENFAGIVRNEFGSVILPKKNMSIGIGFQYLSVGNIYLTRLVDMGKEEIEGIRTSQDAHNRGDICIEQNYQEYNNSYKRKEFGEVHRAITICLLYV